jgi:hypothetical protein
MSLFALVWQEMQPLSSAPTKAAGEDRREIKTATNTASDFAPRLSIDSAPISGQPRMYGTL